MRITRLSLAAAAVTLTGMLAVCAADPAFAASKKCTGLYEAVQNGQCVTTSYANPNRQAYQTGRDYYRSSKKSKTKKPAEDQAVDK
jgi:hypothetical protein